MTVTIEQVRDFWDQNPLFQGEGSHAPGTRDWFLEHERIWLRDVMAGREPGPIFTAGLKPSDRILDVGCGPGLWVRYFLRQGFQEVSACDLTPRAVELTRRSLELFGLKARVQVGNAQELPYPDQSFDHLNCQGVIHHTPDPGRCLAEFQRVLKPGGTLCLSVYYRNFLLRHPSLLRLAAAAAGQVVRLPGRGREALLASGEPDEIVRMYDGRDNPLGRAFTRSEMARLMAGRFHILETGRMFFPARALPFPIPPGLHHLLHRRLGLMIIFRARRLET